MPISPLKLEFPSARTPCTVTMVAKSDYKFQQQNGVGDHITSAGFCHIQLLQSNWQKLDMH